MGKNAQFAELELSPEEKAKLDECVNMMVRHRYGEEGPPRKTTFAEIEQYASQIARTMGRAMSTRLAERHSEHYQDEEPCPGCGQLHPPKEAPRNRPLQTDDGEVTLREPVFRCPTCHRDFFPDAH